MNIRIRNEIEYSIRHAYPCWDQTRGSFGKDYWEVYSPKIERDVKLYSYVQYIHWLLLEADQNVVAFCEQPIRMLAQGGDIQNSFVDMWVLFSDGSEEYRGVEFSTYVNSARLKKKIHIQKLWCERNKYVHRVVTDLDLKAFKILIDNCKEFIVFIPELISIRHKKLQQSVREIVSYHGQISIKDLIEQFVGVNNQQILSAIFTLIHSGQLQAPIDKMRYSKEMLLSIRK